LQGVCPYGDGVYDGRAQHPRIRAPRIVRVQLNSLLIINLRHTFF
jgi:hypothetical protein